MMALGVTFDVTVIVPVQLFVVLAVPATRL